MVYNDNAVIHIGEEPNFKEFRAHFSILFCRTELQNSWVSRFVKTVERETIVKSYWQHRRKSKFHRKESVQI